MRQALIPPMAAGSRPKGSLQLRHHNSINTVFAFADLLYLEAIGNYTCFYLRNGKRVVRAYTLKVYLAKLPDSHFIQTHRKYVINIYHVARIERENSDKGEVVYLRTGTTLAVSRRRYLSLKRLLGQYRDSLAKRPLRF
jgi:DNA-binding LytR/AlgR family response regulator